MRTAVVRALVAAGSWLLVVPSARAQAVPIGPDFCIGGDLDLSHAVRAAIDPQRWFVTTYATAFVWWPDAAAFSDRGEWQGWQALDDYGITWWSERPVDVATVGVDDFMAVWETNPWEPPAPERTFIRGRRISAHAVLLTDPFEVTSSDLEHPRDPRVAALQSSRVVVVWVDDSSDGADDSGTSIQARHFTIDGVPLGPRFQVNTTTLGDQTMPDVAAAPDSSFVVVWESDSSSGSDGSGTSIQLRRFDAAGIPVGDNEQVNTFTNSDQSSPRVACGGDGRLVVVWESDGSDGDDDSSLSVQARRFAPDGTPAGADFQVNTYTDNAQSEPAVAMMAAGSFEVVWTSDGSPGNDDSSTSIQRRPFRADGVSIGDQLQVNTVTSLYQLAPDIAMTAEGDFVVVWDDASTGLRGRIYRQPLLSDGFESGDTSAWSSAVP
jgi:hypothetical protein